MCSAPLAVSARRSEAGSWRHTHQQLNNGAVLILLRGTLQARDVVPYMAAQVLGAVAAAAVVSVVLGQTFAPAPGPAASAVGALLVEVLYTTALGLVVLHSATLVGPFVGGALAAAVYRVQQPAEATPQEALAARADLGEPAPSSRRRIPA
jgi:hypothetical protein